MLELIRTWKRPKYEPLNRIEILSRNIIENVLYLQSIQPRAVLFPVLKSNAYGHGVKELCKILDTTSVPMLAVDSFPEAQIVYRYSDKKVLVIGEAAVGSYRYFDFSKTEFCVYSLATLQQLALLEKKAKIHLFINTGMNREGIQDLRLFLTRARRELRSVEIVGLCSHLAAADQDGTLNQLQQGYFFQNLDMIQKRGIFPRWIHLGNTAGIFTLDYQRLTAFRPGIGILGYNIFDREHPAFPRAQPLKPALRVISRIVALQKVGTGEAVSYNQTFKAARPTTIAVIPFGYAEGLDRRLSNRGIVYVGKDFSIPARIAGNVCMNLTCIDVGDADVHIGDEVELISGHTGKGNSIRQLARLENTIPYEVLVRLSGGIRRTIVTIS